MDEHEWTEIIGAIGLFLLLIIVVTGIVWHFTVGRRSKQRIERDYEYRAIAEEATRAQQRTERQLTELSGQFADMRSRVDSLERILKEVE